jgi:hypothetical protein
MLKGVRVSFPALFIKPIINGQEGKCGAALMLSPDKHAETIAEIEAEIAALIQTNLKGQRLPADKLCLRDGFERGRPEYEGYQILSANSKNRPVVLSSDGSTPVYDEDKSQIYSGCLVKAKIRLWAQDNKFGKRINAELVAIQFAGDGEPLDGAYISPEEAAEGFESEDDFLAA